MNQDDSLRVLITMNDPRIGGPQLYSLAVAKQIKNRGFKTEFLLPDGDDIFANLATEEGFIVHRPGISRVHRPKQMIENVAYLLSFPLAVRRIERVIDARSIDVVHTRMSTSFCPAVAASRSDASLVWHFNDTLVPRPIKDFAARAAIRLADRIVVAAESVHDYYFSQQVDSTTIYSPVDVSEFDPSNVRPTNSVPDEDVDAEDPIIIGTVANVNPIKGLEYFIRAIASVNEYTNRPVHAPIVGGIIDSRQDYYEDLLKSCKELGIEENVHFLGRRDDVSALLADFDMFVLASVAEACPMAVLEAMAMEKPVIVTQVGGIPEQIDDGEHGWIVPPEDPDAVASAIMDGLKNETEAKRRGKRARERVCSKFSLAQCVKKHESLYQDIT